MCSAPALIVVISAGPRCNIHLFIQCGEYYAHCDWSLSVIYLGPTILLLRGGEVVGVQDDFKKKINILQVHMGKIKFLHKSTVQKEIHARTVGWKRLL